MPGAKSSSSCTTRISAACDLEEAGEHLHRAPARVHEALRQHEPGACCRSQPADQRLVLGVLAQRDARLLRKALDQPEAGIVARALVVLARIAQADHETDGAGQGLLLLFLLGLVARLLAALVGGLLAGLLAGLGSLVPAGRAFGGLLGRRLLGRRHLGRRHGLGRDVPPPR